MGAGLAPLLAAHLLEAWGWRSVFLVMVPLTALVAWLVEYATPDHEPVEHDNPGQVHAGGTLALQFALERVRFDMFGASTAMWVLALLALVALGFLFVHGWWMSSLTSAATQQDLFWPLLLNSVVSIATVILQMRVNLHDARLTEAASSLSPLYANGAADPSEVGLAHSPDVLMRLSAVAPAWQKKFV
jgi:MFS family permease